jgi:PAS domain S-box-containing protein
MEADYSSQTILDFLPDAVIVSDSGGIITSVNTRTEQLFGYSSHELLGMQVDQLVPDELRGSHGRDRRAYYQSKAVRPMGRGKPLRGKRKDGSTFPVEISLSPYAIPGEDLVISIIRDVTEREQLEDALREGEARYRILLDQSPEPIVVHALGTVVYVNEAAVQLFRLKSPDEMIGRPWLDFIPAEHVDAVRERLREFPTSGTAQTTRMFKVTGFDGEAIYIEAIAARIMYRGQPAAQIMLRDMTERITQEEELRRSREELRNLSSHLQTTREAERAAVARELHDELGSALTALKMDLASLEELGHEADRDAGWDQLTERIASMASLIDDTVRTMRRIVTELRPALLDSLGLIAAIEWHAEEFQQRTGIECRLGPHPDDLTIDKERATSVFRIFQETLTNVARHAGASSIDVEFQLRNGTLMLRVTDDGRGIAEDQLAHTQSFGLLGMRERALLLRGELTIEGTAGKGTTVTLRLPLEESGTTEAGR